MKAGDKVLHKLTGGEDAVCLVDNLVKIGDEGYIWYRDGNDDKCTCDVFIMNILDNKLKLAYDADFQYPLYRLYDLKDVTVINYKNYKL